MSFEIMISQWEKAKARHSSNLNELQCIDQELAADPVFEEWEGLQLARVETVNVIEKSELDLIDAEEAIFYQILFRSGWNPEDDEDADIDQPILWNQRD